jgi:hypothetical protein
VAAWAWGFYSSLHRNTFLPPKEPAMTQSFASKFTALCLAAAVTASTLAGVNALAQFEAAEAAQTAQQHIASAPKV